MISAAIHLSSGARCHILTFAHSHNQDHFGVGNLLFYPAKQWQKRLLLRPMHNPILFDREIYLQRLVDNLLRNYEFDLESKRETENRPPLSWSSYSLQDLSLETESTSRSSGLNAMRVTVNVCPDNGSPTGCHFSVS